MTDEETKVQTSTETPAYKERKYDYLPLSPKLIAHVRQLNGLNVSFDGVLI